VPKPCPAWSRRRVGAWWRSGVCGLIAVSRTVGVMAQPTLHMTAAVIREGGLWETFEESVANLREALELYFEDEPAPLEVSHPIVAPVEVRLSA